jgi:hypothetical protein
MTGAMLGSGLNCSPSGLAADFARAVCYSACINGLMAIDAVSGDRLMISQ